MKKNIYVLLILTMVPGLLYADANSRYRNTSPHFMNNGNKKFFIDTNNSKNQVSIVNPSEISEVGMTKESFLEQQKTQGYAYKDSSYPSILLKMGKEGADDLTHDSSISNTHMKYKPSEVGVSFDFKQVPNVDSKDIIGFSPRIAVVNGKWTGISEFFNNKKLGTCKYHATNMALTGGSVKIASNGVRYDVNDKPSDIFVEGNPSQGFIYNVIWFHGDFMYGLECANMKFDKAITQNVIELAKVIDKNNDA